MQSDILEVIVSHVLWDLPCNFHTLFSSIQTLYALACFCCSIVLLLFQEHHPSGRKCSVTNIKLLNVLRTTMYKLEVIVDSHHSRWFNKCSNTIWTNQHLQNNIPVSKVSTPTVTAALFQHYLRVLLKSARERPEKCPGILNASGGTYVIVIVIKLKILYF